MKAVLLDVYQTILTGRRVAGPEPALQAVARSFGLTPEKKLTIELRDRIAAAHRSSPDPYPEIDIREIWNQILPGLDDPDAFALAAENAIHPVSLIPGARDAIIRLHDAGLRLGIVSNAQAYTPRLLARHLGPVYDFFDPALCIFSYQHRIAKPDPRLFRIAIDRLGIPAPEILMIGDSEPNDLAPARALGLQARHVSRWLAGHK